MNTLRGSRWHGFHFWLLMWAGLAGMTGGMLAGDPSPEGIGGPSRLEAVLLQAVQNAYFEGTRDFGPYNEACPGSSFCPFEAPPIGDTPRIMPNADVAVIALDSDGQVIDIANVLLSRDYRQGQVVPIDENRGTRAVRWRRWDIQRFDGGTFSSTTGEQLTVRGWVDNPPLTNEDDITPGLESAPLQFMAPYPASLFKVLVAYYIMRLVDGGVMSLKDLYTHQGIQRPMEQWLDRMITFSSNSAAEALLKRLHELSRIAAMNATFADLGLYTLQINGTNPKTGGNWQPGQIHMTALDTARLFWLIDGGSGTLWTKPNGDPVTAAELSDDSRAFLKGLLAEQGFNEVLSNTNFCGAPNTNPGIPARVSSRWINAEGVVTVDGHSFGRDVRPCNETADVIFGHKTGLTFNYGADAGIVYPIDARTGRRYVIAFLANLGYRYTDDVFAQRRTFPCFDTVGGICYTQRLPALGKQIDDGIKALIGE